MFEDKRGTQHTVRSSFSSSSSSSDSDSHCDDDDVEEQAQAADGPGSTSSHADLAVRTELHHAPTSIRVTESTSTDSNQSDDSEQQQQQPRDGPDKHPRWFAAKASQLQGAVNDGSHWLVQCATILAAALLTHSLAHEGERVHVQIAIMTVIVLFGAVHPQLTTAAGCGAFAGGQSVTPSYAWLVLLAAITGFYWCFVATKFKLLNGFGGRMGTATFCAMNTTMLLFLCPTGAVSWQQYGTPTRLWNDLSSSSSSSSLSLEPSLVFVASLVWLSCAGAACRIYAQMPSPSSANFVLVPVGVALASMLLLNATEYRHRGTCYAGFAVGSYVAMASLEKLTSVREFAAAGLLAGGWGLFLMPFFNGFGGKAGFTAFLGHATYMGVCRVRKLLLAGGSSRQT